MGTIVTVCTTSAMAIILWAEYWPASLSIPVLLALLAAFRAWKRDALVKALSENRLLRRENTKLELEAKIRLDELAYRDEQIDGFTKTIAEQRTTAAQLANDHARHRD
jgi:hypothetical protein